MCGILGFFSSNSTFNQGFFNEMIESLKHRGPDSSNFFQENNCNLGHLRLSIIDLSNLGNQPMISQNDRYVIIYNGETYNFKELKQSLKGISWKSHTDTEVILEGWTKAGEEFIKKMNGMFALAIYDRKTEKLTLIRDRLGIKPLYIYRDSKQNFAFASELKSLQQLTFLDWKISKTAITLFLHLGYIPAPFSIFENVYKLPPATIATIDSKHHYQEKKYWEVPRPNFLIKEETAALDTLESLLKKSVEYRMIADVSLGIFLSGGVDSSIITALASQISSKKVKTFSIGFQEGKFNETAYAQKVASYLGTEHQEEILLPSEAQKLLPKITQVFDEPFADVSALPTMLVSAIARKKVTVVLGGDGADELFWGYGAYHWAKRFALMQSGKGVFKNIFQLKNTPAFRKGKNMMDFSQKENLPLHLFSQEHSLFSEKDLKNILNFDFQMPLLSNVSKFSSQTAKGEQAFFDLKYYLPDDLLVKIDRASMQYSLEARVPFLDHNVVEFAQKLSTKLKYQNKTDKYLLKKLLFKYLPKKFFNRSKWGFGIPLADWLQNPLKEWVEDILTEKNIREAHWVNIQETLDLKEQFLKGDKFLAPKVWAMLILHQFYLNNKQLLD